MVSYPQERLGTFTCSTGNIILGCFNTIRHLGVTFDARLIFDRHISKVISDENRIFGFVVRNSKLIYNILAIKILRTPRIA